MFPQQQNESEIETYVHDPTLEVVAEQLQLEDDIQYQHFQQYDNFAAENCLENSFESGNSSVLWRKMGCF